MLYKLFPHLLNTLVTVIKKNEIENIKLKLLRTILNYHKPYYLKIWYFLPSLALTMVSKLLRICFYYH